MERDAVLNTGTELEMLAKKPNRDWRYFKPTRQWDAYQNGCMLYVSRKGRSLCAWSVDNCENMDGAGRTRGEVEGHRSLQKAKAAAWYVAWL